jgi:hypothetical protein
LERGRCTGGASIDVVVVEVLLGIHVLFLFVVVVVCVSGAPPPHNERSGPPPPTTQTLPGARDLPPKAQCVTVCCLQLFGSSQRLRRGKHLGRGGNFSGRGEKEERVRVRVCGAHHNPPTQIARGCSSYAATAHYGTKMLRQLKPHEQKLLKKVNLYDWKRENNVREIQILRRYRIQKREDYTKYVRRTSS